MSTTSLQDASTIRGLRRGIGGFAIALPFVLIAGNALFDRENTLVSSISGSYYTSMRDVFVGIMCAIGVFLICYRYDKVDDRLSTVAGVLAITVALFRTLPTDPDVEVSSTDTVIGLVHQVSAVLLFVLLAYFCLVLFTRSGSPAGELTPQKRQRNQMYRLCGWVIVACIVLAAASTLLSESVRQTVRPLFWLEATAVFAFGVAWFVKGETIFKDSQASSTARAERPAPALAVAAGE